MRTKFITPNYFSRTQNLPPFLRLPLSPPPHPPPSLSSFSAADFDAALLRCANSASASLELVSFPIDDALSKFYSDVLPHPIDVDHGGSLTNAAVVQVRPKVTDLCYEKNAAHSCITSNSDCLEHQLEEEKSEDTVGDKNEIGPSVIQFEAPELTQEEIACLTEKEEFELLSELQECDDNLEMLNLVPSDPFGFDSVDSVNSVEAIGLKYDMTLKLQMPDDVDLLANNAHLCDTEFPLFEVDELGAVDLNWLCIEDECHSLLEGIEEEYTACHGELELTCQDSLLSSEIDILECISGFHTSQLFLASLLTSLNTALDIDMLELIVSPYGESSGGVKDADPHEMFLFEAFEMLDSDAFDIFEALAISQTAKEPELCDQLFQGDLQFKSFDDLIVNPELAISDDSFTSLPVPVLVDDERMWSLQVIDDAMLAELQPLPFSASDEIYLDWHLLGNEKYSGHVNAAIEKVFTDTEDYTMDLDLDWELNDCNMLVLDFLSSDDSADGQNTKENRLDMPSEGNVGMEQQLHQIEPKRSSDKDCQILESQVKKRNATREKVAPSIYSDDDCQIIESSEMVTASDTGRTDLSLESTPQVNDLDFFLNPRKPTSGARTDCRVKTPDKNCIISGGLQKEAAPSSSTHMQQLNIRLHTITLSADILTLIDSLRRNYLAILRDAMQLEIESRVNHLDDMNLLRLSEKMLMDHLSRSSQQRYSRDDIFVDCATLCAIKRMAWCLCFYGIFNLHLFQGKLFQRLPFLKPRLCFLHTMIEDAYVLVDKEITKSHPSLATIKEILQQNGGKGIKVLILAQRDLWGSLKRLLSSMNVSCTEVEDQSTHRNQPDRSCDLSIGGLRGHMQTECLLLQHECISPSILAQKFDLIVECGGPCSLSKVSTLHLEHLGSQSLHFLKVELDAAAKSLCEGVITASDDGDTIKLEELLNFGALTGKHSNTASEASGSTNPYSSHVPLGQMAQNSEPVQAFDSSFPDMIIIVNTQNFDKEMIISRRSAYQKILSMEKKGVQVVERDLLLPVDIILDASSCVAWYDWKNIGKKATDQDEGLSNITLCIENLATTVLTSLSFTFTACVMVFEGESSFLGTVMELADGLYAAAASLGIDLQVFYSYSFELTDEILLNTIGQARASAKGLLPRMPETETHVESFLTKVASINPISAHGIIHCGCMLLQFLELSADSRIHVLKNYHLPEESVYLLSILFKYGEREESKSGLTDCSSSVSSPPGSKIYACRINSEDRKRKLIPSHPDSMHDLRCSLASERCINDGLSSYGMSRPSSSKLSKSPRISLKKKLPDLMLDAERFAQRDWPTTTAAQMDYSKGRSKSDAAGILKVPLLVDDHAKSALNVNINYDQQELGGTTKYMREECDMDIIQDLRQDFEGEVKDMYGKFSFDEDFQATEGATKSPMVEDATVKNCAPKYMGAARKLSFGGSSNLIFPTVDAMNLSFGLEQNKQSAEDNNYGGMDYNWDNYAFKPQQELMGTCLVEKSIPNFSGSSAKQKVVPACETRLSRAVDSEQLPQGSPWTIEFLNRIKEKRKLRQQNQPWGSSIKCIPQSGSHGNFAKVTKRSPSILQYYKYQGATHNSTPRKVTQKKYQKQKGNWSNEKPLRFAPAWTPVDKKARRSLSFAASGSGSQTKLVWSDKTSSSQDRSFSNSEYANLFR